MSNFICRFIQWGLLVSLILFVFACGSSQDRNFNDLKNAFISWYLKTHPVKTEDIFYRDQFFYWKDFSAEGAEEYLNDIRRFAIELSQIDRSYIQQKSRLDYDLLVLELKKIAHELEDVKKQDWDVSEFILYLHDGLKLLANDCGAMTSREEKILKNRLNGLKKVVNSRLERYKPAHLYKFELANKHLQHLTEDLSSFWESCQSDSILYERWKTSTEHVQESLDQIGSFIELNKNNEEPPFDFQAWKKGVEISLGDGFEYSYSIDWYKQKIQLIHEDMLRVSLPVFLMHHDEPVWVSYQDTLNVIKSVLNQGKSNTVNIKELAELTRNWISSLKDFYTNNNLFPEMKFKSPTFRTSHHYADYTVEFNPRFGNPGTSNYYLPALTDSNIFINEHEQFFKTLSKIYPGDLFLLNQSRVKSRLQKLFYDDAFLFGWVLYCEKLLIENGYFKTQTGTHLYALKKQILLLMKIIIQQAILDNHENIDELLSLFDKWSFGEFSLINNAEFEFISAAGYLTYLELLDFKNKIINQKNNQENLIEFHKQLIESGAVNITIKQIDIN